MGATDHFLVFNKTCGSFGESKLLHERWSYHLYAKFGRLIFETLTRTSELNPMMFSILYMCTHNPTLRV